MDSSNPLWTSPFSAPGLFRFIEDRVHRGIIEPRGFWRLARALGHLPRPFLEPHPASADPRPRLRVGVIPFSRAAAFSAAHHRHLRAPIGHVFSVGIFTGNGVLCGVAIVGRPVARMLDNGSTLEITRVAVDGTRNACSAVLAAARREARRRGIQRLVTYTLPSESGASLRAAGFKPDGRAGGGSWSRVGRPRLDIAPTQPKLRWVA